MRAVPTTQLWSARFFNYEIREIREIRKRERTLTICIWIFLPVFVCFAYFVVSLLLVFSATGGSARLGAASTLRQSASQWRVGEASAYGMTSRFWIVKVLISYQPSAFSIRIIPQISHYYKFFPTNVKHFMEKKEFVVRRSSFVVIRYLRTRTHFFVVFNKVFDESADFRAGFPGHFIQTSKHLRGYISLIQSHVQLALDLRAGTLGMTEKLNTLILHEHPR